MGLKTADMPPVDPAAFASIPFMERMRLLATHWCEYGFGGPKQIHLLYVFKLIFYVGGGFLIAWLTTPGLGGLGEISSWWTEPIFYQKLLVWTVFFEVIGLGGSSGPLAFKFSPMIGGFLYWGRTQTLRVAPWPGKVPFTAGDTRTAWDAGVYWAIVGLLVYLLAIPGDPSGRTPASEAGLLPAWALLGVVALICLMGLRDSVVFLAARAEQYLPPLVIVAVLSMPDMIIALKILIVAVWLGAGVSKFGRHFTNVVAPMVSNTPWITSIRFKRSLYRDFPNDIRPSKVSSTLAHVGGTVVELAIPLVLLFSTNLTITLLAVLGILLFHAFIISTFPLAVPNEWNAFFMFAACFLFLGYPAGEGYAVTDMTSGALLAALVFAGVAFPILGNLRPDIVSFLPSMRQYAGNWASATWAFRGREAEEKLNTHIVKPAKNQIDQLTAAFGNEVAEIFLQKAVAWRTMHSQGRALISLMLRHTDDIENYVVREAEFICNTLTGWNFGDGHLHDERLITAVQKRCGFEPGELIITFTESQPIHRNYIEYRVIDAALGVVERGTYVVKDATDAHPWLPDGPIKHRVTWTAPGYRAAGDKAREESLATVVEPREPSRRRPTSKVQA
jgi:uncharacterized membrane protein YkgB